MSDEYLWSKTGRADPELKELEGLLGRFRLRPRPISIASRRPFSHRLAVLLAIAAALLIGIVVAGRVATKTGPVTAWRVTTGAARSLRAGELVETNGTDRVRITADAVGEVEIEPRSKLRIGSESGSPNRFGLRSGTIHALIWAPPGEFTVDTPSAKAIDLGCRYTLQVSENGLGKVVVETGWVAFEWKGVESFIPAGAMCITRPGKGPGTPVFQDASAALSAALSAFDEGRGQHSLDVALDLALANARQRDSLSLWHLMRRTQGSARGLVFDRYAALVDRPPALSRDAILRGDPAAFDAAWDALQLGETGMWRRWKQQWRL